jgi:putative CocE/NonD family hydrolase
MGPLANANKVHFKDQVGFWNEAMRHGVYDEFWKSRNLRPHLTRIRPAVMTVGGWFDAENLFGALETYKQVEATSPGAVNTLVMGPWEHGGWARSDGSVLGDVNFNSKTAVFFREQIELPFFELHLKEKGSLRQPEAWVFETGTNQWRRHDRWPPAAVEARSLYFDADGRLGFEPPQATGDVYDEYLSDPNRPVPYFQDTAIRMEPAYMVGDQRFASRRPDVLVYQTDALDSDITCAGPLSAELHVSTTGTDSDWVVKLIDVYPNDYPDPNPNPKAVRMGGYQQLVRGDVIRGKFRNSLEQPEPFKPGEATPVKLVLHDIYHTFRTGHRVMVQVQSSWFPLFDRNPQSFVDIYQAQPSDFQPATQRVYRSRGQASRLSVSILP